MTIIGYIHGLPNGQIGDDSTIVIDGVTYPIPLRGESRAAPHRIWRALQNAGYRPDGDYYDALGDPNTNGVFEIRLVKV